MKNKKLMALFATAALAAVLALVGCSGSQEPAAEPAAPDEAAPAAEAPAPEAPANEAAAPEAVAPEAAPGPAPEAPAAPAAAAQDNFIGEQAALEAALAHVGIAEADAQFIEVELDLDDAVPHYEVEFKSGGYEYSFDIDAATGAVMGYEFELDD